MHPHELKILKALEKKSSPLEIAEKSGLKEDAIWRASSWLSGKSLINLEEKSEEEISLGKEGEAYLKEGLPERQVIALVKGREGELSSLQKKLGKKLFSIALGWLRRKKLAQLEKGKIKILTTGKTADEKLLELVGKEHKVKVSQLTPELIEGLKLLKERQQVVKVSEKKTIFLIPTSEGKKLAKLEKDEGISQVTPHMLTTGKWKKEKLRSYDIHTFLTPSYPAKLHPLQLFIEQIRKIFLKLGFQEVSGPLIESSFWNFDALFVAQDHPARDMQDTFYLKNPQKVEIPGWEKLKGKIKKEHERSWGSWDDATAKRTLLRTHTTSVTARYLSTLKKENLPQKIFCIGKTFRNEAIDYKHLPEFYQVEGIVVDEKANFRHLLGILKKFYDEMGFPVRFRPGYFPYTEPSVECEVFLKEKGEWLEMGGAGIFRPEMVKPLLGFDCPVLAWGLGLERLVTLSLNLKDIRDIYISDLDWLRKSKVV